MALIPVRNVEALIVTRQRVTDPLSMPVVQTYIQGAQSVRGQVALSGELNYTSWEQAGQSTIWPSLQVNRYPTIIFVDMDTSKVITRLVAGQITSSAVAQVLLEINRLQRDAAGNYFDADGNWLANKASENAVFTSPFGLGVFNVSIPPLIWAIGGLYTAKKALDSPAWPGMAGYTLLSYLSFREYQKRS